MKLLVFILSFLIVGYSAFAQKNDSTLYSGSYFNFIDLQPEPVDSLFGFYLTSNDFNSTDLGNPGSVRLPLVFQIQEKAAFSSSLMFNERNWKFYLSETPTTYASYSLGTNKAQELYVRHVQKFGANTYANLIYRKTRSEGFYLHQLNDVNLLNLNFKTNTKNKRYELIIMGQMDQIKREENGGLNDDSLFRINYYSNPRLYDVQFTDGVNKYKNWFADVDQNLRLLNTKSRNFVSLFHQFSYRYNFHNYTGNPLNGFYNLIYNDSILTNDQSELGEWSNAFGIRWGGDRLDYRISLVNSNQHYLSNDSVLQQNQNAIQWSAYMLLNQWKIKLNARYVFNGIYKENYVINADLNYQIKKGFIGDINVKIHSSQATPDLNEIAYNGNHFKWNNILLNQRFSMYKIGFNTRNRSLAFNLMYQSIDLPVYFDTNAFIRQDVLKNHVFAADMELRYTFFKHLTVFTKATYQYVNSSVIRVPDIIINSAVFYNGNAWTMQFNTGIGLNYYSAYYANSFNPNLSNFYLQNQQLMGNYPMMDVFFESRIKTVKVFLSVHHVAQGLFGNNYFISENYPMFRRCFRMGLSWNFFN